MYVGAIFPRAGADGFEEIVSVYRIIECSVWRVFCRWWSLRAGGPLVAWQRSLPMKKKKITIPRLFSSDVLVMALRAVVGRAFLTSSLPHVFIMVLAPSSRCSEKPCIVLIRFIRLEENTANLLASPIRKFRVYWRAHDPIQITTDR